MKINAVGVASTNIPRTLKFYSLLGVKFPETNTDESHLESIPSEGSAKLMIDSFQMLTEVTGKSPVPANHSVFAIEYKSPDEVNKVAKAIKEAGFEIEKEPWDAFWGQRYSILVDPDGYKVDLYSKL
jgi:uncharacterized glyoxalase superfamily protein PhnB